MAIIGAVAYRSRHPRTGGGLSLRARVLAGLLLILLIAVGVALAVTVTNHRYLMNQLDDRLIMFANPDHSESHSACVPGPPTWPAPGIDIDDDGDDDSTNDDDDEWGERPSDVWRGLLCTDGVYQPIFNPTAYGDDNLEFRDVHLESLSRDQATMLTLESEEDSRYRVIAEPLDDGWEITALSMEGVESATRRLVAIQAAGIGALALGLGLVGWWVLRLGVTPMRRLVAASTRIAEGDMEVRLDAVGGASEAAALGQSLNVMVTRLTGALAERERSEARLREFVADASHELRTPLTTVLGYAQLFRKGALTKKADQADAWRRTEAEAARMKRLVEDMLELARFDAEPELRTSPTALAQLVDEVLADAGRAHPLVTFARIGDQAPTVLADADRLRQAVINVVANAAQHGARAVGVELTEAGGTARIAIRDDGPGMSPEVAARATERFVRGDESRSRATGGAGLGLAITAAIVGAHGGLLKIESALGKGSTVTIEVPIA